MDDAVVDNCHVISGQANCNEVLDVHQNTDSNESTSLVLTSKCSDINTHSLASQGELIDLGNDIIDEDDDDNKSDSDIECVGVNLPPQIGSNLP